jgi:hypothetical protein
VRIESAHAVVLDGQAEKANRKLVGGCCGEHVPERALYRRPGGHGLSLGDVEGRPLGH